MSVSASTRAWLITCGIIALITVVVLGVSVALPFGWYTIVLILGLLVFLWLFFRNPALWIVRLAASFGTATVGFVLLPSFSGHLNAGSWGWLVVQNESSPVLAAIMGTMTLVLVIIEVWRQKSITESVTPSTSAPRPDSGGSAASISTGGSGSVAGAVSNTGSGSVVAAMSNPGSGVMVGTMANHGLGPMFGNANNVYIYPPANELSGRQDKKESGSISEPEKTIPLDDLAEKMETKLSEFFGYESSIISIDDSAKVANVAVISVALSSAELQNEILGLAKGLPLPPPETISILSITLLRAGKVGDEIDLAKSNIAWCVRMPCADLLGNRQGTTSDKQLWEKFEFRKPQGIGVLNRSVLVPTDLPFYGGFA